MTLSLHIAWPPGTTPCWIPPSTTANKAAEKAVKGFLVLRGQSFGKTHDIRILIEQAEKSEPGFALWQEAAARLTPYAAAFRYPGDFVAPDREEYSLALQAAENLVAYIHSLLPLDLVEGL